MRSCVAWLIISLMLAAGAGCDGGDDATGGGDSAGTGGSPSTSSAGAGGADSCAPPEVLSVLQAYLEELDASADLLSGHPSAIEAVGFFAAPGLPAPPANAASYYTLVMTCAGPTEYDPYCDQGKCSQLECTGSGSSWANHLSLDAPPKTFGDFAFQQVAVDIAWAEGATGISFETMVQASGPGGANWALSGTGYMDTTSVTLQADLPKLFAAGPATLAFEGGDSSASATVVVEGVTLAEMDASGNLVPTGACP